MLKTLKQYVRHYYRHGPYFQRLSKELAKSEFQSQSWLDDYHNRQLQKIIRYCYRHIPYYRDLFRRLQLTPEDFKTKADLAKLPYLDKHLVRENYDKLIAENKNTWLCNVGHTSGSTGTPGKFLRDPHSINFENAALWRQWRHAGDQGDRRVTLRGDIIVPLTQDQPPFWDFNPINKELRMSSYHLSLANSKEYVTKILNFQPEILYAHPSTALLLASVFEENSASYQFKAIFTSSETLPADAKTYIEAVFGCSVTDWYGQAERVVAIGHCEKGSYHIVEDYSIVEMIDTEYGTELVGTHLHNYVMPLLRYRTGDYFALSEESCVCGRTFRRVDSIQGRLTSYLITPEGYKISILNHIPRGVNNIIETQFYQDTPGEVIIYITANGKFTELDRNLLIKNTLEHTSPHMKVMVQEVPFISRGPNGKFVSLVSKLDMASIAGV
ncbi:hypothetical protein [Methylocaldum sp.]|uniref:phenylacetate--CoA ligase family protein n=1 Tax=Methylocaldum sp. TaxID=1969727 RepID=UPI002D636A32|nr:hypothetical protein [Methylocaldum sp.]HYE36645.1 hypothetical protein [Methylocaldum sp.]